MARRQVKTLGAAMARTNKPVEAEVQGRDGALSDFVAGMQQSSLKNEKVGIGTARDQRMFTSYVPAAFMNRVELENIYMTSWLGNRIVRTLPESALRNWRTVSWEGLDLEAPEGGDTLKEFARYEKKLKVKKVMLEAWVWGRLYGGALLVPVLKSQPDDVLDQPLDLDSIEKDDLVTLRVFDRWRCAHDGTIVSDALDPQNGMPEHYRLAESTVRLHHTRVIRFDGRQLPYFPFRANSMWHDSVLRILVNNLKQYDTAVAALTTMLFQLNVDVIKQAGLRALLSTKGGAAKAIDRFREFAITKAFNGIALLDKDSEEFERHPYTFSGVDKAFDKVMFDVCGAADTPFTRLFGQSPAGLNATGESDTDHWNEHVVSRREESVDDPLAQLDEILVRSFLGTMPDGYESTWAELEEASEKEMAETEASRAQTAQAHWNMGVIDEGVVAKDVHARQVYQGMTKQHVKNAERTAKVGLQQSLTNSGPGPGTKVTKKDERSQALKSSEQGEDDDPKADK